MRSRSFRWLFFGVLVVFVMVGVNGGLDLYVFTYFWELDRASILLVICAYPVGVLTGSFFCPAFFNRFGKKAGLIFGGLSWAFWQTTPIVARLMDWFPDNGEPLLISLLVVIKVIQGASTVQANVAFGSMVADIIDEHEYETGKRQEGIFFAASSFSAKATSGIGNVIAGVTLDLISWPRGAHIRTASDVPPENAGEPGHGVRPHRRGLRFRLHLVLYALPADPAAPRRDPRGTGAAARSHRASVGAGAANLANYGAERPHVTAHGRRRRSSFVDQHDTSRAVLSPPPHDEIQVPPVGADCKTPHPHADVTRCCQLHRETVRRGHRAAEHVGFPGWTRQVGRIRTRPLQCRPIFGVEHRLRVDLVGAKRQRLHRPSDRLRLSNCGDR